MNWLVLVGITIFVDALRIFLDNYISDVYFRGRDSAAQKIFHGTLQIIVAILLLPVAGKDLSNVGWLTVVSFFVSGFVVSLAGIPYYKALELDDSTNLGIFMQLSPVLYLVLGWLFLGETISPKQLVAFVIILSAPLLILKTTSKKSQKTKVRALFYAFIYILVTVLANLLFVKENSEGLSFLAEMALFYFGKGSASLLVIYPRRKWRERYHEAMKEHPKKLFRLLAANALCTFITDATYRLTLATAPTVAIASAATDSAEPIVIFFMGIILTLINPRFGREKLNKKSIVVHLLATVLVVIGVMMIQ